MPTTRKKVIKTVYKDEDDSEPEGTGDFSDSGSDAKITDQSSSEEDQAESSGEEFEEEDQRSSNKINSKSKKPIVRKPPQFAKSFLIKIRKVPRANEIVPEAPVISVKDLTDADKLLPSFLDLSESDSSEDESPKKRTAVSANATIASITSANGPDSDDEAKMEYQDVWSNNIPDNSEEIAQKTFKELELHKTEIEQTKASILNYAAKSLNKGVFDVKDLLAQGEEVAPEPVVSKKKTRKKKLKTDSDSEIEDWEEVQESKALPASGLQVVVDFPDAAASRKSKKLDIEMMMRRKMNRVKKEYQVYMHKVHVLCWLGHGNYVSSVLNNQEILSAVLSLVPSKECYPGERVDVKYILQITKWFNNKLTFKQDKNENKFRPKAPPLKDILLKEINSKVVSTKKYMVFIFVSILRALGLQCRVMFNFVTLPIKPPSSELCSLSTKVKDEITKAEVKKEEAKKSCGAKRATAKKKSADNISQVDGNDDSDYIMQVDGQDDRDQYIMQVDGNDDSDLVTQKSRKARLTRVKKVVENTDQDHEDVSPPKRAKRGTDSNPPKPAESTILTQTKRRNRKASEEASKPQAIKGNIKSEANKNVAASPRTLSLNRQKKPTEIITEEISGKKSSSKPDRPPTNNVKKDNSKQTKKDLQTKSQNKSEPPNIVVTNENNMAVTSSFFENASKTSQDKSTSRTRSQTINLKGSQSGKSSFGNSKSRSKSADTKDRSKYFNDNRNATAKASKNSKRPSKVEDPEDNLRVSHRDVLAKTNTTPKNDVKADLITIMKTHIGDDIEEQEDTGSKKRRPVKRKVMNDNKDDSDYQPDAMSDDDFKPTKISPKPSTSRKIDRRVISTDDEAPKHKTDVWCEVFVEELEQWIAVDVMKGKVHCTNEIYSRSTHPVCYVVGWDNSNYLKDLTRRYVPHWNTVTRKQRAEPGWWAAAAGAWRGPRTARDKEEDDCLDRLQMDAPLPKSIAEYKNHPLYALKRHLLKFEAIYPPDAATLGFVRNEAVYARDCVYVCRSRDTWLKEAKVVKLGEKPYKIVKARPKWDKLSNKCITDKPLEVFGPWQVQDYEPPVAENGVVPRNAYGNVELFKECMLPKGTAHVKLPGLNRVAKKLNIDCAPAMTGFDFNGGWSHPVYDGYVVCKEFEEIITEAWLKDQEEQERREREKTDSRVYGNWKRLIKGLMIRERLKLKYGFEEPSTSANTKKPKGPRLVVKKT